ncbi:uncharacterized protein DS421_10g292470 [Arachis hypogaea]|nr:uncharacterized protein DS421_10g292470 [Arachis hypogaea]
MRGRRGAIALGRYQLRRILRGAIAAQTASVSFSHRRCRHVGEREKLRKAQPREPEAQAEGGVPPSRASHQAMTKLETLFLLPSVLNRCCCHELGIKGIPASNPAIATLSCQDSEKGKGWKRFEFDKDAPLEDEEIEVAEDDASLARKEEQIQAAHDKAMFGASALPPPTSTDSESERENEKEVDKKAVVTSLLSETGASCELVVFVGTVDGVLKW